MFGHDIREVSIIHRAGKENVAADALSQALCGMPPVKGIRQDEVQVATVNSNMNISTTLNVTTLTHQSFIQNREKILLLL